MTIVVGVLAFIGAWFCLGLLTLVGMVLFKERKLRGR